MYVVAGAFLFVDMVIWFGFFFDFLGFVELMEEMGVLIFVELV